MAREIVENACDSLAVAAAHQADVAGMDFILQIIGFVFFVTIINWLARTFRLATARLRKRVGKRRIHAPSVITFYSGEIARRGDPRPSQCTIELSPNREVHLHVGHLRMRFGDIADFAFCAIPAPHPAIAARGHLMFYLGPSILTVTDKEEAKRLGQQLRLAEL